MLCSLARGRLRAAGGLRGPDQVVATEGGERAFAAGDRIMFGRNERGLGGDGRGGGGVAVKNGTLGTVRAVAAAGERTQRVWQLTVRLNGPGGLGGSGGPSGSGSPARGQEGREGASGRVVMFSVRDYGHVDHGYAATVHKARCRG